MVLYILVVSPNCIDAFFQKLVQGPATTYELFIVRGMFCDETMHVALTPKPKKGGVPITTNITYNLLHVINEVFGFEAATASSWDAAAQNKQAFHNLEVQRPGGPLRLRKESENGDAYQGMHPLKLFPQLDEILQRVFAPKPDDGNSEDRVVEMCVRDMVASVSAHCALVPFMRCEEKVPLELFRPESVHRLTSGNCQILLKLYAEDVSEVQPGSAKERRAKLLQVRPC